MVGLNSRRKLLYKATRDGFSGSSFHANCDGKANTVTIIKTDSNFVFGGYTAAAWKSDDTYSTDTTAFIFSLRRNGTTYNEKYMVQDATTAIKNWAGKGPIFGSYKGSLYCDILINDLSNNTGGYADFGASYNLPLGYIWGSVNSRSYLAGSYQGWKTTEIEVFHYSPNFQILEYTRFVNSYTQYNNVGIDSCLSTCFLDAKCYAVSFLHVNRNPNFHWFNGFDTCFVYSSSNPDLSTDGNQYFTSYIRN